MPLSRVLAQRQRSNVQRQRLRVQRLTPDASVATALQHVVQKMPGPVGLGTQVAMVVVGHAAIQGLTRDDLDPPSRRAAIFSGLLVNSCT